MKRAINCWCLETRSGFLLYGKSSSSTQHQQCRTGTAFQQARAVRSTALKNKCLHLERNYHGFHLTQYKTYKRGEYWKGLSQTTSDLPSPGPPSTNRWRVSTALEGNQIKFTTAVRKRALFVKQNNTLRSSVQLLKELGRRNQKQEKELCWELQWPLEDCLSPTPYMKVAKVWPASPI